MICFNQNKRIEKIYSEPIYLLNVSKDLTFKVSGSTANIYTVSIDKQEKRIRCNCPDSSSWAHKQGCICKHCCFILIKVVKLPLMQLEQQFFDNHRRFNDSMLNDIEKRLNQLKLTESDIVNPDYIKKFKKCQKQQNIVHYEAKTEIDESDECIICFDTLVSKPRVECPGCKHQIHTICMEQWIKKSSNSCVFCRRPWTNYHQSNKSRYQNLLES